MNAPDDAPASMIRLHKHVRASRQRVYEALTSAEQFPEWFVPGPREKCTAVIVEPWVGGRFHFEMTGPDGATHVGSGTFTEVVEHRRIAYTWTWQDMPDFGGNSLVTFELLDAANPYDDGDAPATEIILTHERLHTAAERSEHTGGWWSTLRALGYYVRGVDPRVAMYAGGAATA